MASMATGSFTHPDPLDGETYPNAIFDISDVHLKKGANPNDGTAFYDVYKNLAHK
jgi:hypothetical protein